ncbi:MAG TPA: ABC transporter permease [Thermoplasmata archaeon]|nr:ABC transporter permease [Thermoplasmata archaeon]
MGRTPSDLAIFIGKRLLQLIPVLLGVILITFLFTHIAVANPCAVWLKEKHASSAVTANCMNYFGINKPLDVQFFTYLNGLVHGNLGIDPNTNLAVASEIGSAVPATLELVLAALVLMVVVGIPLGVIAANSNGRIADHLVRIFYLSGWATPTYLAAILLAVLVGPSLGLPTKGDYTGPVPFHQYTHMLVLDALLNGNLSGAANAFSHLILPAVALAFLNMGIAVRMTRSSMLEVLPLDYIKTARMKGLSEFLVLYKHALRNSLITTVTVLGITAGTLLSGTIVIEEVFQWPGIGAYAYAAITTANFPGAIAVVVVFALGVVIANFAADILYGILDPRVEWR